MNLQNLTCLMIDLDDTLYPHNSGAWDLVLNRINQFLLEEMAFPADEVPSLRSRLYQEYGTTLRGLQTEFSVDRDVYLTYVHDVPLEEVLSADPELDLLLEKLPHRKVIFTNAYLAHAHRVVDLLGVARHFDTIVDVDAVAPHCKPQVEAYHKALAIIEERPEHCMLVDDTPSNLETAQTLGFRTISVGQRHHNSSPHIDNIKGLNKIFFDTD